MMSIFGSIFRRNERKNKEVNEESLNESLKARDKEHYKDEAESYVDYDPQTAYDVIARLNHLQHQTLNIYKNAKGDRFVKTEMGFQPAIVYNQALQLKELHLELKTYDETLKLNKQLNQEIQNIKRSHRIAAKVQIINRTIMDLEDILIMIEQDLETYSGLAKAAALQKADSAKETRHHKPGKELDLFLLKTLKHSSLRMTQLLNYINKKMR